MELKILLFNLNFFILHAKRYIYQCKIDNKDLFLIAYINTLKQNVIIEKNRYSINGEYELFADKWSHFSDVLLDDVDDQNNN